MLVIPLVFQANYWADKFQRTFEYNQTVWQSFVTAADHFFSNLIYSWFLPLYTPEEHHFVAVGHTDPITAALVFLGLGLVLVFALRKNKMAAFFLASYMYLLVAIGTSHDRTFPPTTRMFLMLPLFMGVAACGLVWFELKLRKAGLTSVWTRAMSGLMLAVILGANTFQAYSLSYHRMSGLQNLEALFLQEGQIYFSQHPEQKKSIFVLYDPELIEISSLTELLDIYEVDYNPSEISGIKVADLDTTRTRNLVGQPDTISIVDVRLSEDVLTSASELLRSAGKIECPVTNSLGDTRFFVWHDPEDAWTCPQN